MTLTGHGSRYVDDVHSWQTIEPALAFTSTAALAFALLDSQHGPNRHSGRVLEPC